MMVHFDTYEVADLPLKAVVFNNENFLVCILFKLKNIFLCHPLVAHITLRLSK